MGARVFKKRAQQEIQKRRNVFSFSSQIFIKLTIWVGYNGRKKSMKNKVVRMFACMEFILGKESFKQ